MVDVSNSTGLNLSAATQTATNIAIIILSIALVAGALWAVYNLYILRKRYNEFVCVVWRLDSNGNPTETYDKAGVFTDKITHNKRFYMQKTKGSLNPDRVPFHYNEKGKKIVYVLQTGLKQFNFISPSYNFKEIMTSLESPEEKEKFINTIMNTTEADLNWAVDDLRREEKLMTKNDLLMYMPYIIIAFVSIIILILFMNVFKRFDTMGEVAVGLKETSKNMIDVTNNLIQIYNSTYIPSGGIIK